MNRREIFDIKPVSVTGPINHNRARVLWRAGKLYVLMPTENGDFRARTFDAPEPPARRSPGSRMDRTYEVKTEDGKTISMAPNGCNCGYRLGKVNAVRLIQQADRQLAAEEQPRDEAGKFTRAASGIEVTDG